ncbi:hypothetical protein E2562_012856 [Oryza meyeriana var. granulata]|uniref:Plastid division protein PDV1 n=1 Tax=Oryza meyeriana var. granulata TaxID=110450 RepID=A0A6G1CN82_9ORYZ|nr:hypothetical protein E2562_012856 [Oryza meyeriana var. granulata]
MRLSAAAAAAEAERIWDLHDKLSHAILSLTACARSRGAATPPCRCCRAGGAPDGCVVVKGWRRQQGGCGYCGLEQEVTAGAAMADARSLHAVRAALEDLEGNLHFLHNVQLRQVAERDAAITRLQQSRTVLATRLAEHRWKKHEVIEEALAFVDDVLDKSRFVSPEDVCGTHTHSQSVENEYPKGRGSNLLVRVLSCALAIAKNSLRLQRIGGALGNTAMFAVSMLAFLQLHQVVFGKQTPAVQYRRVSYFHSQMSTKNTKEKHLEL